MGRASRVKKVLTSSWLVYYYNKLEMDANINSLYGEMMTDELIEYDDTNFNRDNLDIRTIFRHAKDNTIHF